jgi:8-oxo-dGTP pyrophosphatase MutT (NUDIX family)
METNHLKIVCSGALFYAKSTNRFLFLQKSFGRNAGTWGLVGGTTEQGETAWQGLQREIIEEIGHCPTIIKTIPLESFVSNDEVFNFFTYLCLIDDEFIPSLSGEHDGWCWATMGTPPKPLHPGLKSSFSNKIIKTKIQTIIDLLKII